MKQQTKNIKVGKNRTPTWLIALFAVVDIGLVAALADYSTTQWQCGNPDEIFAPPCGDYYWAIAGSLVIGLALAVWIFTRLRVKRRWLFGIAVLQLVLFFGASGLVTSIKNNKANTQALSQLNQSVAQMNFTMYLPTYLPSGFRPSTFLPNSDNASIDYDLYNNGVYADPPVSISLQEQKVTLNYNPPVQCYTAGAGGSCTFLTKDTAGDSVYTDSSRTDLGNLYFVSYGNTYIMFSNDPHSPISQGEMVKIFNSLAPQTKQQLQALNSR